MGSSDGEDLMFGLVTMAAVCYLSSSLALMRLSAEKEEKGDGMRRWRGEQRTVDCYATHPPHTHHSLIVSS